MPEPQTNESRDEFIERCIPIVIDDGTAEDNEQAFAVCNSMWEQREKAGGKRPMERKTLEFKVTKFDYRGRTLEGYAAAFNNVDLGGDVIHQGAFTKTLAERGGKVKFLWQHDPTEPLGRPIEMREDENGLFVKAIISPTSRGNDALALLKDGAIDGLSIGYDPVKGATDFERVDSGETVRHLKEIKLFEFSLVTFPMNESATVTGLKAVERTEDDGKHPASHYLVVEDAEKPSTWHLRVMDAEGNLDHRLMGAAWAALHGGYRGNRYEGPGKEEAISKLRALYEQEDMTPPEAQADGDTDEKMTATIDAEIVIETEEKAGRVLAARNAQRITSAITTLIEALDDAGIELDGFTRAPKIIEPEKSAPERAAIKDDGSGAGPQNAPTLEAQRLNLLLEIEKQKI